MQTAPTQIVEDTAGRLFRAVPMADIDHAWLGVAVKRSRGAFVAKTGAREQLVRKAGCTVVAEAA